MFTKRLIENASTMFTETPPEVMYAYSEYQQMFGDMKHIPNVTFHEGLPDKQTIEEFSKNKTHTLLILDDLISKIVQSEELTSVYSNISPCEYFLCSAFTILIPSWEILQKHIIKHSKFHFVSQPKRYTTDSDVCLPNSSWTN